MESCGKTQSLFVKPNDLTEKHIFAEEKIKN